MSKDEYEIFQRKHFWRNTADPPLQTIESVTQLNSLAVIMQS